MKKSVGYSQHTRESVGQFKTVLLVEVSIPKSWSNSALPNGQRQNTNAPLKKNDKNLIFDIVCLMNEEGYL